MSDTDEQARAAALLIQFKADLLTLATREPYNSFAFVVIAAALDVAEGLMRRAVRAEPAVLPNLLARLDDLRAHVQAAGPITDAPASTLN